MRRLWRRGLYSAPNRNGWIDLHAAQLIFDNHGASPFEYLHPSERAHQSKRAQRSGPQRPGPQRPGPQRSGPERIGQPKHTDRARAQQPGSTDRPDLRVLLIDDSA